MGTKLKKLKWCEKSMVVGSRYFLTELAFVAISCRFLST
jgi:hypothetical protein